MPDEIKPMRAILIKNEDKISRCHVDRCNEFVRNWLEMFSGPFCTFLGKMGKLNPKISPQKDAIGTKTRSLAY